MQKLKVYNGFNLIETLIAPEGGKLEATSELSGALRVDRWFFGDPLEVRQPAYLFAPNTWTKAEEVWE